jgi:hypothetical protein
MEPFRAAQGDKPLYVCGECNEPVLVIEGVLYRPCAHAEAPVLANLEALVYGQGATQ